MSKLVIKKKQGVFVFSLEDIVYMEKRRRKIYLYAKCRGCGCGEICGKCNECSGYYTVEFYGRFAELIPYLDNRFMFCHRSYVINMDAIVWMSGCEIYIITNESIHMGRDAYSRARKLFVEYLNEKYPEKTKKNTKFFL